MFEDPSTILTGQTLLQKVVELSPIPFYERIILCGYYRIVTLENMQKIQQANLHEYFLRLIEAVGLPSTLATIPEKPLTREELADKMNALSALPRQEKAILCGYYINETLANGQQIKQANLTDFFNAAIEATFSSDELLQIRADDAEFETEQET